MTARLTTRVLSAMNDALSAAQAGEDGEEDYTLPHEDYAEAQAGEDGEEDYTLPHEDYAEAQAWVHEQLERRRTKRNAIRRRRGQPAELWPRALPEDRPVSPGRRR